MKIEENSLSSAITSEGITPDTKFFQKLGSFIPDWLKSPLASASNLLKRMGEGAKELFNSIRSGSFKELFKQWAKDDPVGAAAGTVAAGLAAGTMLIVGGAIVGWVVGSVGAVASSLGVLSLTGGGAGLGNIVGGLLNTAEQIYTFNWNVSDKQLLDEIKSAIDGLYNPAGEFLGRQFAGLLVGGATRPPKVEINVKALALAWSLNPDIRQDLLQNVSNLALLGMQTFQQIAIKYAFLKGRQGIKALWKKSPKVVKQLIPGLDKAILNWGEEGSKPWSFESVVNEKVENISDERIKNAVEGFLSGFWGQFRESVEYVYN